MNIEDAIALWEADGSLLTVTEEHDQALELIIKEARLMAIVRSLPEDHSLTHGGEKPYLERAWFIETNEWKLEDNEATFAKYYAASADEALLAYQNSTEGMGCQTS